MSAKNHLPMSALARGFGMAGASAILPEPAAFAAATDAEADYHDTENR